MSVAVAEGAISLQQYFARTGSRFRDRDAEILGPWLEEIGPVSPAELVRLARAPQSPGHDYFEWDNQKASEHYRILQAADMRRSINPLPIDVLGFPREVEARAPVSVRATPVQRPPATRCRTRTRSNVRVHTIPHDPVQAAAAIRRHFTPLEVEQLIGALQCP